jgi:hypothetical protein
LGVADDQSVGILNFALTGEEQKGAASALLKLLRSKRPEPAVPLRTTRDEMEIQIAERHVVEGERIVALQCELIQRLSEKGHPTERAERVLVRLETALEKHRKHLNRPRNSNQHHPDCC